MAKKKAVVWMEREETGEVIPVVEEIAFLYEKKGFKVIKKDETEDVKEPVEISVDVDPVAEIDVAETVKVEAEDVLSDEELKDMLEGKTVKEIMAWAEEKGLDIDFSQFKKKDDKIDAIIVALNN